MNRNLKAVLIAGSLAALIVIAYVESDAVKAKSKAAAEAAVEEAKVRRAEMESEARDSAVRQAVLNSLRDPDSAKFGRLTYLSEDEACITVNARNSFGGYSGDKQAIVSKLKGTYGEVWVANIYDLPHEQCVKIFGSKSR